MTRAVVVNHFPVLPARGGGQLAVLGLAGELAVEWPTELIWTERKRAGSMRAEVGERSIDVTVVPNLWLQRQATRWLRYWVGAVENDLGTMLFSVRNAALHARLVSAVRPGDVLVAAHPWCWPALRALPVLASAHASHRAVLVYDAHNVEHVLKAAALPDSVVTRWLLERVRRLEADLVRRADLVLACTPRDAEALQALAGVDAARFVVGSKGIDPSPAAEAMAGARAARAPGRHAIFVGSKHGPNNEAAHWIATVLAPARPRWQFTIAGACGPAADVATPPPNVRITGPVDDLDVLLAEADLALNPMAAGSGINMKLFEALRCGLPVLSTPLGARGFETAGAGIVVAEREGFAAALEAITADTLAWRSRVQAGPQAVAAQYTWPVVGARVRARIAALLETRVASAG